MRIIAGSARGKKLIAPRDRSIRPALDRIRESLFSIIGPRVESVRVLDLFSGTGAFGLEALSRGARHVTFVDRSPDAIACISDRNWSRRFSALAASSRWSNEKLSGLL